MDLMFPPDPTSLFAKTPVVPVLTIARVEDAVPLAKALVAGGITVMEVTLRTDVALDAARAIAAQVPEAVVGIGTVTQIPDIRLALSVGAKFIATPGTPPALAAALAKAPVPAIPACATVSEAMALSDLGFSVLKFFPAATAGGIEFLKAIAAPLPHIKFWPSGGIDATTAAAYLALPNVVAVGGSWIAPKEAVAAGDFAKITALAKTAATLRR
jgi:2-dehydro-3-deoxyphosphogluconate aldolase/(4S)-4-hydroxy-2-oxoglutarate aldolase